MPNLKTAIAQADAVLLEKIFDLALHRYNELYPDWEISTVSVQKSAERNKQPDRMIALLQRMKDLG